MPESYSFNRERYNSQSRFNRRSGHFHPVEILKKIYTDHLKDFEEFISEVVSHFRLHR